MQYIKNVTLLGAGQVNKTIFADALAVAPVLIAADGGAKIAVKLGHSPKFVIGDFDSIDSATLAGIPESQRIHITEQDTTDFEKCLKLISAPVILGVGFLGHRLDHQLAAINVLAKYPDKRCILLSKRDLCFHLPAKIDLDLPAGSRFSLFPIAPVQGRSNGLRWPIDGVHFSPAGQIGTSNQVADGPVSLRMKGPGMIAILPQAALPAVLNALQPR